MNLFSSFLICLMSFFGGVKVAYMNGSVVDLNSGVKFFLVPENSFGEFMQAIPPTTSISSIFGEGGESQIFNPIISSVGINMVNGFIIGDRAVVHDPNDSINEQSNLVQADLKIPISPSASSPCSGRAAMDESRVSLRGWEMASWPLLPHQTPIDVIKTRSEVFLARNFLDALVIGRYSVSSDSIHLVLVDVVVRSCWDCDSLQDRLISHV